MNSSKTDWLHAKIMDREKLVRKCNSWRGSGKKIVFTNGCFDLLHTGHLDYLARAADLGNMLVVGLNSDASVRRLKGPERPVNRQDDRALALAALLLVDAVCIFDQDTPLELIQAVKPDVLAKGGDYTPETIVGTPFVVGYGGTIAVLPFVEGYSTTALLTKIRSL